MPELGSKYKGLIIFSISLPLLLSRPESLFSWPVVSILCLCLSQYSFFTIKMSSLFLFNQLDHIDDSIIEPNSSLCILDMRFLCMYLWNIYCILCTHMYVLVIAPLRVWVLTFSFLSFHNKSNLLKIFFSYNIWLLFPLFLLHLYTPLFPIHPNPTLSVSLSLEYRQTSKKIK